MVCLGSFLVVHDLFVGVDSADLFFLGRPGPRFFGGTVEVLWETLFVRATDFCLVASDFFRFFVVGLECVFLFCFSTFDFFS